MRIGKIEKKILDLLKLETLTKAQIRNKLKIGDSQTYRVVNNLHRKGLLIKQEQPLIVNHQKADLWQTKL